MLKNRGFPSLIFFLYYHDQSCSKSILYNRYCLLCPNSIGFLGVSTRGRASVASASRKTHTSRDKIHAKRWGAMRHSENVHMLSHVKVRETGRHSNKSKNFILFMSTEHEFIKGQTLMYGQKQLLLPIKQKKFQSLSTCFPLTTPI